MSYLRTRAGLLARFRNGERDALAEVYRAYLPRIRDLLRYGFTVKRTGLRVPGVATPDDLADAVQEVFTRAFRREARSNYDGLRDYAPYLATIARNVVITQHRRRGRELMLADTNAFGAEDLIAPAAADDDAEPWFDARALEIARRYVAGLEGVARAVHAARYVNALSQRDAARELGLSRPKVRKLEDKLRRGLAALLAASGVRTEEVQATARTVGPNGTWTRKPRTS